MPKRSYLVSLWRVSIGYNRIGLGRGSFKGLKRSISIKMALMIKKIKMINMRRQRKKRAKILVKLKKRRDRSRKGTQYSSGLKTNSMLFSLCRSSLRTLAILSKTRFLN